MMRRILSGIRSAALFAAGIIALAPLMLWATVIQREV